MNKKDNFIKSIIRSVLLIGMGVLIFAFPTYAVEKTNTSRYEYYADMIINPEYADILDVEALQAEQKEIKALTDQTSTYAVSPVHTTFDAMTADVRAQMVKRNPEVTVRITRELYDSIDFYDAFYAAMEHSEACSGQEGDALARVWSGCSGRSSYSDNYTVVTVTYILTYMSTYEQELELTAAVNEAIDSLNMENDDDYTKVYKIYNYICDNVDYDFENLYDDTYMLKYTAYAAMCDGTAVCQGYAVLFYRMCKEVGVPVRYINGYGNGGRHAWNIAKIGDFYYNLDSTWDGQDVATYDNYFLKNMADFEDHQRHDEFLTAEFMAKYPMSSMSWTDFNDTPEKLNATNYNVTFNTINGSTVNTTANGKPKLLIFYSDMCTYSRNTIKSISGANLTNVDIVAINVIKSDADTVATFKSTYGSDSITFTYDSTSTSNNYLWNYAHLGGYYGSISYPVMAYIDSNNVVQYVTYGPCGADTVKYNLNYYCGTFAPTVEETNKTLNIGDTHKIITYLYGEQLNNAQLKWSTSNAKIATVDANGVITAVGSGNCTITGKLNDKYSVSINIIVNLDEVTLHVTEVKNWQVGYSSYLIPSVNGVQVPRTSMMWKSSNPKVVTCVDGKITAVGSGTATITCTKENGTVASCKVTVIPQDEITLHVTEVDNWKVGYSSYLIPSVNGVQVSRTSMTWKSSNPKVVTCVDGKITAVGVGTATITCTKENGTVASCKVTVKDTVTLHVTEVKNWQVGYSSYLIPYVNGTQVSRTSMTWKSSNPKVVTCVDGKITAVGAGTATITCTKENGTVASCKVTVLAQDIVTLHVTEVNNWQVGYTSYLMPSVNGVQVSRTSMIWKSSNPKVVTCVDGKITAVGAGTATITCTKENGTVASCKVTVLAQDIVTLHVTEVNNWQVGYTSYLMPSVNGVQVSRTSMTWKSSNPKVVTCVDGKITAVGTGTATITCTKANGTVASCKVTVIK